MPKHTSKTLYRLHPRLLQEAWVGDFELPSERPLTTEEAAELLNQRTRVDGEYSD